MKRVIAIICIVFLAMNARSQDSRYSIGFHINISPVFVDMYGLTAKYHLSEKVSIGTQLSYSPGMGSSPFYEYPRWRAGIKNEIKLGHSRKYVDRKTWYTLQYLDYGFERHNSIWYEDFIVSDQPLHIYTRQMISFGLGLGRQFNFKKNWSFWFEGSFNQHIYSSTELHRPSPSQRPRSELLFYYRASGLRLEIGVQLRLSSKNAESLDLDNY